MLLLRLKLIIIFLLEIKTEHHTEGNDAKAAYTYDIELQWILSFLNLKIWIHHFALNKLEYENEQTLYEFENTEGNNLWFKFETEDAVDEAIETRVLETPNEAHEIARPVKFILLINENYHGQSTYQKEDLHKICYLVGNLVSDDANKLTTEDFSNAQKSKCKQSCLILFIIIGSELLIIRRFHSPCHQGDENTTKNGHGYSAPDNQRTNIEHPSWKHEFEGFFDVTNRLRLTIIFSIVSIFRIWSIPVTI